MDVLLYGLYGCGVVVSMWVMSISMRDLRVDQCVCVCCLSDGGFDGA